MKKTELLEGNTALKKRVAELEEMLGIEEDLHRDALNALYLLPPCPDHGRNCIPYYRQFIKEKMAMWDGSSCAYVDPGLDISIDGDTIIFSGRE